MQAGWALLLLATFAGPPQAAAATGPERGTFVFREVRLGEQMHRFAIWLPPGHDARAHWPALVFLNGAGECGRDGEKPVHAGLGPVLEAHPERWPFVVVFPQKPAEEHEWEEHEDLIRATLALAVREYRVDRTRVALTGMSQGGHGTWYVGARDSSRWRALVPVCGYGRGRTVASRVSALPVWAFHGLRDDVVNPDDTREIVRWLRDAKRARGLDPESARMTLYPDANHNSWDAAYGEPELPAWLVEQTKAR